MLIERVLPLVHETSSCEVFFTKCSQKWQLTSPTLKKQIIDKLKDLDADTVHIIKITSRTYPKLTNVMNHRSCIVCGDDFDKGGLARECNECKLVLHSDCQEKWEKYSGNTSCPQCRNVDSLSSLYEI